MKHIHDLMTQVLAQPDMAGMLIAYKADFTVHDLDYLQTWGAPGVEYLWVVRSHGTHLARLCVHAKPLEWLTCAMDNHQSAKVFHVTERAVNEISRETAVRMASVMEYSVQRNGLGDDSVVLHRGTPVAQFTIRREVRSCESPLFHLEAHSRKTLSAQEVGAVRIVVMGEHEARYGFFAAIGSVTLDGGQFSDAMSAARQREKTQVQPTLPSTAGVTSLPVAAMAPLVAVAANRASAAGMPVHA